MGKAQNSFFIAGSAEGSADDAIASSAMESYKTQNLFGLCFEDPSEDPKIQKYRRTSVDPTQKLRRTRRPFNVINIGGPNTKT